VSIWRAKRAPSITTICQRSALLSAQRCAGVRPVEPACLFRDHAQRWPDVIGRYRRITEVMEAFVHDIAIRADKIVSLVQITDTKSWHDALTA